MKSTFDFLESPLAIWVNKANISLREMSVPKLFDWYFKLVRVFFYNLKAKSILDLNELDYDNFPNGQYFYMILKQTDPRLQTNSDLPNEGDAYDTTRSRLLNLDFILRNIRSFYQVSIKSMLISYGL